MSLHKQVSHVKVLDRRSYLFIDWKNELPLLEKVPGMCTVVVPQLKMIDDNRHSGSFEIPTELADACTRLSTGY